MTHQCSSRKVFVAGNVTYKSLCWSVIPFVHPSVRHTLLFMHFWALLPLPKALLPLPKALLDIFVVDKKKLDTFRLDNKNWTLSSSPITAPA